jgi:hypothetical protein
LRNNPSADQKKNDDGNGNGEPTDEELLEAYMKAEPMLEVL